MPANLTPQYRRVEEKYRQAQSLQQQIQCLEEMLQLIPKHKGTDRLQGDLRARLKEAREALQAEHASGKPGRTFRIPRQGAGSVMLIGAPNAGKSRLLSSLTAALPEIAPYPYTTREPQAGMLVFDDLQVQIIDHPPVAPHHVDPSLINMLRSADLAVLCLNGSDDDAPGATQDVLRELRQRKTVLCNQSGFDEENFSIVNLRTLLVVTHAESADANLRLEMFCEGLGASDALPVHRVELETGAGVAELKKSIVQALPILRVYTRRPGETSPDPAPVVLPTGANVEDLARKIHEDLVRTLKHARVWSSTGGPSRTVPREHLLQEADIVELYC